jgi:hypothetical protein
MNRTPIRAAALALLSLTLGNARAEGPDPGEGISAALLPLLAAAGDPVKAGSGCDGSYGHEGPAKVGDVLSRELTVFYRGKNRITGSCRGADNSICSLSMTHAFGEDVSSTELHFRVRDSKAIADTLRCVMTP